MSAASDSVERTKRKETGCRNTPQRKLLCQSGEDGGEQELGTSLMVEMSGEPR